MPDSLPAPDSPRRACSAIPPLASRSASRSARRPTRLTRLGRTRLGLTRSAAALGLVAAACGAAQAISLPIQLDGDFDDWTPAAQVASDPAGDAGASVVDFTSLFIANDENLVFLRFNTTAEVQPDENQSITLYLDTDMNAATGLAFNGVGADLVWNLGARNGTFYTPAATSVGQAAVGLLIHPTVSATEFELGFPRNAVPAAGKALFPGASFRLILRGTATGGDLFPNSGSITYTFALGTQTPPSLALSRQDPTHVRVASYNVQNDGLFDSAGQAALGRLFNAIDADVWVICEVWNHTAADVAAKLEQLHPPGSGRSWATVKQDDGNVIASRFPILQSWAIFPQHRLSAALIDLYPAQERDLLVVANHWRCCTADAERQDEADALVAFLRDARTPGGVITLPQDTPMVACGDFNLVGLRQQLMTALTGDIADNVSWGPDSPPDWDGSSFDVARSRHPDARLTYTWRNDSGTFYPGRLDWMLYTGSVAGLGTHFVLETLTMAPATLAAYGLAASDRPTASDHSPNVADFGPPVQVAAPPVRLATAVARLLPNVPNPFNPSTEIRFATTARARVQVAVYDVRGRPVRALLDMAVEEGEHAVRWDGRDGAGQRLPSGVYETRLRWQRMDRADAARDAADTTAGAPRMTGTATRSIVLVQ